MATNQQRPTELYTFTAPVILAFPNLFEARTFKEGDKPRYDTKALMRPDHPDFQPLNQILGRMKAQHFARLQPNELHFCLQSGDKLADEAKAMAPPRNEEYYRGWIVLTARTQFLDKQALGVILNGKIADVPPAPDSAAFERYFYGGVEAMLQIELVPYGGDTRGQKPGISCRPKSVLSLNRGDPKPEFAAGSRTRASATWGDKIGQHVGHVSAVDPTAGMNTGII
jgi:hypothetical protein